MSSNKPIGIFDSGVGGMSVWKEFVKVFPNENVIYYADSANCPYGSKPEDEIINIAVKVVEFLIKKECKLIIVACNTATAAAIDFLRANYNLPLIGMEPAVKPAALNSKTKSIAVLATEGTFNGRLYLETSEKFAKDVELNIKVGDKLVDIVENGLINTNETETHIRELVEPLINKNIDYLVLGCTHYPFFTELLKKALPENVNIINPAPAVVKQTKRVLEINNLLNIYNDKPKYEFYSTGDTGVLEMIIYEIINQHYKVIRI